MSLFRAHRKKGLGGERDFALVTLSLWQRTGPQPARNTGHVLGSEVGMVIEGLGNESLAMCTDGKQLTWKRCGGLSQQRTNSIGSDSGAKSRGRGPRRRGKGEWREARGS